MSSEKTPFLSEAISHFELFMSDLKALAKEYPILKPWVDTALCWANKYYIRMDETNVYVITMCKLSYFIPCSATNLAFSPEPHHAL